MPYGYKRTAQPATPKHLAAETVIARSIAEIDRDLDVGRAIWVMERRGGADTAEARASKAHLDRLLDERGAAVRATGPQDREGPAAHDDPTPRASLDPPPAAPSAPPGSLSSR
jgi:hypothetical protein